MPHNKNIKITSATKSRGFRWDAAKSAALVMTYAQRYSMIKTLLIAFVILLLSGCGNPSEIKEMFEKQELAKKEIKDNYGWEAQVGFNVTNGTLTYVSVILNAEDVRTKTIENLEVIASEVITKTFGRTPQTIYIQVASFPSDES